MTIPTDIYHILKNQGPKSSSEVREILVREFDISSDAATQRISRAKPPINKIKGWLPRNEAYLYLDKHRRTHSFERNFYKKLLEKKSVYGIALASVISRGGIINESEFYCITGSPYNLKKQTSGEKLKRGLLDEGFITSQNNPLMGASLIVTPALFNSQKESAIRARLITEEIFISLLKEWLEKNCYIANDLAKYRGVDIESNRKVGQFSWDIESPSYLRPLKGGVFPVKKPGFVVCDVLFRSRVTDHALSAFIKKIKIFEQTANSGSLFPMFIAYHFEKEAFNFAKSEGVLITTPQNLFGKEVGDSLNEIMVLFKTALEKTTPEMIESFIEKTTKYYEKFSTLKGYAFELICAHLSNYSLNGSIYLQKIINVNGKQKEIDIMNVENNNKSIIFIEAKSKERDNLVTAEEVRDWKEKTDVINQWLKEPENASYRESSIKHELWVNTDLDVEAKEEFKKIKSGKKEYLFVNGSDIRKISTSSKINKGISDALKNYF